MREYKVVVAGNGGVGKSALTVQFVQGCFVSSYDATIEDSYRKHVTIDGEESRMEILDTAGTEQFSGMRDLYVRTGQGFLLVYSVEDSSSFRQIQPLAEHILKVKEKKTPMVIVGNKSDMSDQRAVDTDQGRQLAASLNCSFFETSAKFNLNVSQAFLDCARQIRDMTCDKPKKRPRKVLPKGGKEKKDNSCCSLL